jgi:flavin reductase (DIM6/NTAB) family NADH-FMN oxidoreductase RutF
MLKEFDARSAMKMTATRPVMIITTLHENGIVNAGVFGSYTNLSPDQLGMAIHKGSHTYENIIRSREFVINVPGKDIVETIKILADDIPETKSELDVSGLTQEPGNSVDVPHISECVGCVECILDREIAVGSHSFIIGKAVGGFGREEYITPEGRLDVIKAGIFHCHRYPDNAYVIFGEEIGGDSL